MEPSGIDGESLHQLYDAFFLALACVVAASACLLSLVVGLLLALESFSSQPKLRAKPDLSAAPSAAGALPPVG